MAKQASQPAEPTEQADAESETEVSVRRRFTVPPADASVHQWLDAQDNLSSSLRTIIRESIERDGYVDATCKPVTRLPRRGRPPVEAEDSDQRAPGRDAGDELPVKDNGALDLSGDDEDDNPQQDLGYKLSAERAAQRAASKPGPTRTTAEPPIPEAELAEAERAASAASGDADDDSEDDMKSLFSTMR